MVRYPRSTSHIDEAPSTLSDPPYTYYVNADFDLGLRPRPRQLERPGLARQIRELSVQSLLGAHAGDCALIRAQVPTNFLDYLTDSGIALPRLLSHPDIDPGTCFRPFGWSSEAIALNRRFQRAAKHPPLSVIRRVNSRSFARQLEVEISPAGPLATVVESREQLESFLGHAPATSAWVVKSEFGNAGLANRRLRRPGLSPADRRFVDERLAEDDRLVVEPWLSRERDWCMVFEVPFEASTFRLHETVYTSDGALIGALFDPDPIDLEPWSADLAATAERIAARLAGEGYFGPVCVDAFTWNGGERTRLRALVDLNCRLAMSDGAYRLWRRVAPEQTVYYRFFNRRKLDLPEELSRARALLEDRRYDRAARLGILFASPTELSLDGEPWRPGKLAVIFVGVDRQAVFTLEHWFRRRFEG
jgi:hypothetical protein